MSRRSKRATPVNVPGGIALTRAIQLAGNQMRLARAVGVAPTAITRWLDGTAEMPLEVVPRIVAYAQDVRVSPYTLRPDQRKVWALLLQQLAACHVGVLAAYPEDDPDLAPKARETDAEAV